MPIAYFIKAFLTMGDLSTANKPILLKNFIDDLESLNNAFKLCVALINLKISTFLRLSYSFKNFIPPMSKPYSALSPHIF
jgi:hypothetical protein